jgi:UDP-N-acetylmuramoyl-L-alanyl-D-glutamate--2,6-diaminopimelate ligase
MLTDPNSAKGLDILGLSADSRAIQPGFLFAALPGSRADGRDFVDQAVDQGAVAVLAPRGTALKSYARPVSLLTAENPRRALAHMAAAFYGAQPATVCAVTGTSGKTSVASFLRQIWADMGFKAASLGTLGLQPERPGAPKSLTTPDPVELHACLATLARDGVDHLAMEASSHGLDQYRLDGVKIAAAAFTNLSRDHLDYHPSMAAYLEAKLRLFKELLAPGATAVVNADMPEAGAVLKACTARGLKVVTFGNGDSDLRLVRQAPQAAGQDLEIEIFGRKRAVSLPVAGTFQAANVLAALGLALATGAKEDKALNALARLQGVPGRLEPIGDTPAGAHVYVDYAHKPGALEAVLNAVRPHTANRLVVVFGCGGDRDPGKRPMMGEIAARLADRVIVTDDNPRTEDPAPIRKAILEAAPGATEIGDRKAAIMAATAELESGDTLVIAGKGHETGQIVGAKVRPFDDREVARAAIAALRAKAPKLGGAA